MHGRHRGMRERPAGLALTQRGINPIPLEKPPAYRVLWDSIRVLFTRVRVPRSSNPIRFFRIIKPGKMSARSLAGSVILHGSFILFLIYLHQAMRSETSVAEVSPPLERIYYHVPVLDSSKAMPHIAPGGPGGRPGNAVQPQPPALGAAFPSRTSSQFQNPSIPITTGKRSGSELRLPICVSPTKLSCP